MVSAPVRKPFALVAVRQWYLATWPGSVFQPEAAHAPVGRCQRRRDGMAIAHRVNRGHAVVKHVPASGVFDFGAVCSVMSQYRVLKPMASQREQLIPEIVLHMV